MSRRPRLPAAVLALALLAAPGPAPATERPDYREYSAAVYLPFAEAGGKARPGPPALGLSFPGSRTDRATLDTGSTGVVVAASLVPDFARLESRGEGRLTYTSSGRVMIGRWVVTPLAVHGRAGEVAHIAPLPVLAVTRVECLRRARNCTPTSAPRNIAMIGIGFAREADLQSQSTPDRNPFLHLEHAGRPWRPGYVLTAHGVHVGLSEANTRGAFRFHKLARDEARRDWQPIPMCVRIAGRAPAACGTLLVDTGVTTMYLTLPPAQAGAGRTTLPAGTQVAVDLGTATDASPLYTFRAGARDEPMAPDAIVLDVDARKPPFINTTVRFLAGYDYLYDSAGGYVAFRRHE